MVFRKIVLWILAVVALSACTKHSVEPGASISFASVAQDASVSTRSGAGENVVLSTTESMRSKPFGIYGLYSDNPGDENGTNVFLSTNAQAVSYNSSSAKWEYDPLAYWSINKFYRFRAYHPYNGTAFNVLNSSSVDLISIDYKIASGSDDLMFAFWTGQADSVITKNVSMQFFHALSGLTFSVGMKNSEVVPDGYQDAVTSFWVSGIIPNGTVLYTHPDGRFNKAQMIWIAENYDSSTKYYQWTGSKTFGKINKPDPAVSIFDGSSVVLAIPQSSSGAKGPTKAYFTTQNGGDAVNEITLPAVQWEPGVIYSYCFVISQSKIEVEITIKDWEPVEINQDIHIL